MIAPIAPPLAHAGHWAASLLYLAPILIAIALLAAQSVRDRRRGMQPAADADWPDPPDDGGRIRSRSSARDVQCRHVVIAPDAFRLAIHAVPSQTTELDRARDAFASREK